MTLFSTAFWGMFCKLLFGACSADCFWGMFCRCGSKWQCDFIPNRKQVVNRLKISQGLSTLLFHQWSEVPSRGGVHSDSPYEKLPALQRCHLSRFFKCSILGLLARPSSIRTLLLSGFHSLPALQRCHLSVFSKCCLLELFARFSVKTSS